MKASNVEHSINKKHVGGSVSAINHRKVRTAHPTRLHVGQPCRLTTFARTVLALFFLLASPAAWAAITFDNTPSGGSAAATTMELIQNTAAGSPSGQYVGLRFTSSIALTNVYARATVGGTGFSLDLTEAPTHFIGDLSATAKTSYWFINYPTTGNGTFQVQIYVGDPAAGGVLQGTSATYTLTSANSDNSASANKIVSVSVNGGAPVQLGQTFDVVVCYTVNSTANILVQPAALASFDPNNLRLGNTSATLYTSSDCTTGAGSTLSNQLFFAGSFSSNSIRATYTFQTIGTINVSLSPIVAARSGIYKYNADYSVFVAVVPGGVNSLRIAKTVNTTTSPIGTTVTYTLTATNTGGVTVALDDFVDTLPTTPAAATYVAGSSTIKIGGAAAVAFNNPVISGATLTWGNPGSGTTAFNVPAGGSIVLTFQATIPNTAGAYTNRIIGHIGTNIIGSTNTVGSAAATATTTIGADHGDAPTSYGDALNGIIATVFLGNVAPDADTAFATWQGQTTANGDDITATADEGIGQLLSSGAASFPALATTATTYSLTLRCQGTVTANAVNGWIDFNRNGVFDTSEGAQGTCSGTAVGSTVTLTWAKTPTAGQGTIPTTFTAGASYARFRIARIANTSPTATGADGETEDYPLAIVQPPPQVTVNKISIGGVGVFPFTGTNGLPTTATNITTVTAGTSATVAALTSVPLTILNTATTITEGTLPVGYALTSATCTGLNGTDVVTVDTATRVLTIPATSVIAGAVINCTFTNTKQPVVTVNKISIGGVGTFPFTGSNGLPTSVTNITTVTAGTSATIAALTSVPLTTLNTATTITEGTLPAGFVFTSATCTGLSGTDTVTVDTATRVLTIPATSVIANAVINCTFTNTKPSLPTVTLTKISNGGVGAFTFTGTNGWTSQTITTVIAGTGVAGAKQTLTAIGTSTDIAETIPTGYKVTAISCTGLGAGGTATPNLALGKVTLDASATTAGANIACTFTNAKLAKLTIKKTTVIGSGGSGNFDFTVTGGLTDTFTLSPPVNGTATQTPYLNVTPNTAITVTENPGAVEFSLAAISCADASGSPVGSTFTSTLLNNATEEGHAVISLVPGADYVCTFTNVTGVDLLLVKNTVGGDTSATLTISNVVALPSGTPTVTGSPATITTVAGTGSAGTTIKASGGATSVTFKVTETLPVAGYQLTDITCTQISALAGFSTSNKNLATGSIDVASPLGAVAKCEFTNTKNPAVTLNKESIDGTGSFSFSGGSNGLPASLALNTGVTNPATSIAYQITDTALAASIAEAIPSGWTLTGAICVDTTSNTQVSTAGWLAISGSTGILTIPAATLQTGNNLACTFTNTKVTAIAPTVTVNKISIGGVDTFSFKGNNGLPTTATNIITTTEGTAATAAALTNVPLTTLSTATTITEGLLPPGYTLTSADCTGLVSGDTVNVNMTTRALTIPATSVINGAVIACTFTNTKTSTFVISGTVFRDTGTSGGIANNGIQDGAETGITGTTVKLTNCSSTVYSTTTTNASGGYIFDAAGATPGTVCVEETNLSGYTSTGANVAGNTAPSGFTVDNADKIRFTLVASTSYTSINFGDAPANQFLTDGTKTGIGGSILYYQHTFIAGAGGAVTFSLPGATNSPALSGWSESLYTDSNCNGIIDSGETLTGAAAIPVAVGNEICLILKEYVPSGAPLGATNLVPVKASFAYTGASSVLPSIYTRQDLTTVSNSAVDLIKRVRNVTLDGAGAPNWQVSNAAKAGETLEYQIIYTNNGTSSINTLVVNDATPPYTKFVSASTGSFPLNLSACNKTTPTSPTLAIPCSSLDTPGGTGGIEWRFTGSLAPASSGAVTFKVKLD